MLYIKFLFNLSFINFIYAGFIQNKLFDGIVIHPERVDGRCQGKNLTYQTYVRGVTAMSTKILIENCTLVSKQGGYKKVLLSVTIDRCRSKENLDTCERYFKQENLDLCKGIDPDNPLISRSPLYVPFVPPLKCPIDKGTYHAYNLSFDLAPFIFFKLEGWYWRVKTEMISPKENKLLYCMYSDGYVTNSKSNRN